MQKHPTLTEELAINELYRSQIKFAPNYVYTLSTRRRTYIDTKIYNKIVAIHHVGRKPWQMAPFRKFGVKTTQ